MIPIGIALAAFCATMCGGLFARRLRDRLHSILGFSAGAVIAVAFFDLIPEALSLSESYTAKTLISVVALGFLGYLLLDRLLLLHGHAHEEESHPSAGHSKAAALSIHSLLDGVGIGLSFAVSAPVGLVVAAAVLAHDFSDGINTVGVVLRRAGKNTQALLWLAADALAPLCGVLITMFLHIGQSTLALLLALFAGFFIYIGASDLVPESHHAHPTFLTTAMTLLGAGVLYMVICLAGI